MKIYIAGPYTKGDVIQNIRNAVEAGEKVAALGHTPYIPHLTAFWHILYPHDIDFWYSYDIEWLKCCDAILRLPGESHGADVEVKVAAGSGMIVYHSIKEIPKP